MKRTLLIMCAVLVAAALILPANEALARGKRGKGMGGGPGGPPPAAAPDDQTPEPGPNPGMLPGPQVFGIELGLFHSEKVIDAMEELHAKGVFDALQLTAEQKKLFKEQLDKIRALRKDAEALNAKYEKQLVPLLEKATKEQKEKGVVSDETLTEIGKVHRAYREEAKGIRDQALAVGETLAKSITPEQMERLRDHGRKWAMMAGKWDSDGPNPVALAFIDRLRLMPDTRLAKLKEGARKRVEQGDLPIDKKQLDEFFSFVDQMRALTPEQYEDRRDELADSLDPVIVDLLEQRRGAGMGRGMGMGMGRGMGAGMGPCASTPGMGPCVGMGPGMGMGHAMRHQMFWRIISSDAFYNLLK